MKANTRHLLEEHGVRASAHRLAVAEYVLETKEHPSADRVWRTVAETFPAISRATVYNTLHLFVEKGLLREVHLSADSVVFDGKLEHHHHFIDEKTGTIYDVEFDRVQVSNIESLTNEFEIHDYQVVMHGEKR